MKPKRNKPTQSSNTKKKSVTSSEKRATNKKISKKDIEKMTSISEQLSQINNKFEILIYECKNALHYINKTIENS